MSSKLECPRCRGPIRISAGAAGPFRGGPQRYRCEHCAISVLTAELLGYQGQVRIARTALASSARSTDQHCPGCWQPLVRMTVSAGGEDWFEIEECPSCGALFLDDAELPGVRELLEESDFGRSLRYALGTDSPTDDKKAADEAVEEAWKKLGIFIGPRS